MQDILKAAPQMASLHSVGVCLNMRSAAVFLRNDEVLLFYFKAAGIWSLPGGRCNLLEDSKRTVIRECQEELAVEVKPIRLLWIIENFFDFKNEKFHEILFVHLVERVSGFDVFGQDEFYAHEAEEPMLCKWVKISELGQYKLLPSLFIEILKKIPEHAKHLVHYDEGMLSA
jgi:8-oxo-dGTP pyrophosphatase MutT (NUDIX family)